MNRRSILKIAGGMSILCLASRNLLSQESSIKKIKPKSLKKGDKITIVAPGSAVSSPDDISYSIEILNKLSLNYEFAPNVKKGSGYKTRTSRERADDLHFAFKSDSKGVFCIRGGYGSASIIEDLDFGIIAQNLKVFAGFSDITALHLAIFKETGLITFHSPVLMSSFNELTYESFHKVIFNNLENYIVSNPVNQNVRNKFPIQIISDGVAEGELVGGNLSLISSLIGTQYEIDTKEKILFIEDIGEAPYRIHRMLTQLKLSGKLNELKGIVIGKCDDCSNAGGTWDQSEMEVYYEFFSTSNYPVLYGLLLGHTKSQFSLPLNVKYRLDSSKEELTLIESPYE